MFQIAFIQSRLLLYSSLLCFIGPGVFHGVAALITNRPVSTLLKTYATEIEILEATSSDTLHNKVFYLRYCLEKEDLEERIDCFKENMKWRLGAGRSICQTALLAVEEAVKEGKWNNDAVLKSAPYSTYIAPLLTSAQVLTTSWNDDLVYCIRAGLINDIELLKSVSVDQLTEFFLYVKEVHNIVANQRSLQTNKLVSVITANDLTNVPLVGGSADFRNALSQSSKLASSLYPSLAGPTLLLNLPRIVSALVKLFTPLFPPSVNKRLKFADAPCLASVQSLKDISVGGSHRITFEQQIETILKT